MIDDRRASGKWKIQLIMKINFISSKYNDDNQLMHSKNNNIKILTGNKANYIINELFSSLLNKYQLGLEKSMKDSDF